MIIKCISSNDLSFWCGVSPPRLQCGFWRSFFQGLSHFPILITLCLLLVQVFPNKTRGQKCNRPGGQSGLYSVSFHPGTPWRLNALRSSKCFKERHIHPEERCSQLWNPCDVSTSPGKGTGSLLLKQAFIEETNVKCKCNLGLGMWIRPWNDPFS